MTHQKKTEFKKIYLVVNSTLDELFNDTTHISLDEYIDRPKLSEQKNPFEYIVPLPTIGVGTKIFYIILRGF